MMSEVTREEVARTVEFWQNHLGVMERTGKVSEEAISFISSATRPKNIGYEMGQVRPGEIGRRDVRELLLMGGFSFGSFEECMLLAGFSAQEIVEEEKREELRSAGVDPDDQEHVRFYELTRDMSPEQLDEVIASLEAQLARSQ